MAIFCVFFRGCGWFRLLNNQRALEVMDLMLQHEVEPSIVSYGTAISACARGGGYEGNANRVFLAVFFYVENTLPASFQRGSLHSQRSASDILLFFCRRDTRQSPPPRPPLCSPARSSLHAHAAEPLRTKREGRWQQALSLLADIPSKGLEANAHAYGSAIHACVVGGQHRRALSLLEEMLERRVVPDAAVFTAAMTAVDGWGAALRLLEVMKREVGRWLLLMCVRREVDALSVGAPRRRIRADVARMFPVSFFMEFVLGAVVDPQSPYYVLGSLTKILLNPDYRQLIPAGTLRVLRGWCSRVWCRMLIRTTRPSELSLAAAGRMWLWRC